ncbi:MAG: hypothetical protein ABIJ97_02185 [Bacteroidota bacterium]
MKFSPQILFFLFAVSFIIICCKKPVSYPETPSIKFETFEIRDSVDLLGNNLKYGMLKFSFIDGNGDIGLNPSDTFAPYDSSSIYSNNLFIELYEYKNGSFEIVDLEIPLYYRIKPRFESIGQNKVLKGFILTKMEYSDYFLSLFDTIKYNFYIYDRALNKSNTGETGIIYLH